MEEENSEKNWRKEVDENLKRLHSLQFGADAAMERRDFSTAHILSLRLVGFLESRAVADPLDEKLTRPIRADALSKLDAARRSLLPSSNLRAFEQAKRVHGTTFNGKGDMDVEKIKQSKYFRALLQQHNIRLRTQSGEKLESQNLSNKTPKIIIEKNFSLYGSNITEAKMGPTCSLIGRKNKSPENCEIIDKAGFNQNNPTSFRFSGSEKVDEGRSYSYPSGSKRPHEQIAGPRNDSLKSNEENGVDSSGKGFVTARAKLEMDVRQKRGWNGLPSASGSPQSDNANKSYGVRSNAYLRRGIRGNFIPPIKSNGGNGGTVTTRVAGKSDDALDDSTRKCLEMLCGPDGELPEKLRNLEPRLIEHVSNEIMDRDPSVRWDDIAGLEHAKKCVTEMVIWPLLRPDIFKGCRSPGRGLLLFGPPGTGKTMIGKAIAGEAKATFFYISASSLTSKWIGEGEKLVRALFGVATCRQPAVIFVDEIDSLLSQRKSEGEHEASRRLKTQFLIEMEGFDSGSEQVLLIGATNRPQELDEAARRRLTKRLYIPLPSSGAVKQLILTLKLVKTHYTNLLAMVIEARAWIVRNLLEKDGLFKLSEEEMTTICKLTEGYSGSDMKNLVKDASMGPLREALKQGIEITNLKKDDMRPVILQDFQSALQEVRPSVSLNELGTYEQWNKQFGSLSL